MRIPWWTKAALQGTASLLPRPIGDRVNHLFQRYGTKSLVLGEARLSSRLANAGHHLEVWRRHGGNQDSLPTSVCELGTGWFPIVPLALALAGVERVVTVDIDPLVTPRELAQTLRLLSRAESTGELGRVLSRLDPRRVQLLHTLPADLDTTEVDPILAMFGVKRICAKLNTLDDAFDLVVSNHTLEHIPQSNLVPLLGDMGRLLREKGLTDHFINMTDHYSGSDSSIGPYHYLHFTDRRWSLLNNRFQFQNRLRASDYHAAFLAARLTIVEETLDEGDRAAFAKTRLASRFRSAEMADLLPTTMWLTATRRFVPKK